MPVSIDDFFAACPHQSVRTDGLVREHIERQRDASGGCCVITVVFVEWLLHVNALYSPVLA